MHLLSNHQMSSQPIYNSSNLKQTSSDFSLLQNIFQHVSQTAQLYPACRSVLFFVIGTVILGYRVQLKTKQDSRLCTLQSVLLGHEMNCKYISKMKEKLQMQQKIRNTQLPSRKSHTKEELYMPGHKPHTTRATSAAVSPSVSCMWAFYQSSATALPTADTRSPAMLEIPLTWNSQTPWSCYSCCWME